MAKNLKLNIKNTQLAEALNLSKPKKVSAKKEPVEAPIEPQQDLPKAVETAAVAPDAAPVAPVKAQPMSKEAPVKEEPMIASVPVIEESAKQAPEAKASPSPAKEPEREKPAYPGPKTFSSPSRYENPSYTPRPPRDSSYPPRDSSSYPPRREGSSYPPRDSSYPPRPQGAFSSQPRREGSAPYSPRPQGAFSSPRPQGAFSSPRPPGAFSSQPRREGSSPYPPRRDGIPPRTGGAPYGPRRDDFKPDIRRSLPPIKEPGKEIPQQHQIHKKTLVPSAADKDAKAFKKPGSSGHSFDSRDRQGLRDHENETWRKKKAFKTKAQLIDEVIRPKELKVRLPITIKDLASEMKLKATQLISKLFMQGITLTLNDFLDDETTVQLLGQEFDCAIEIDTTEEKRLKVTDKSIKGEIQETDPSLLVLRPPVVAFMGHVDHGKTSLIDAIRKANVASSEAGAITQHIGAFKCQTPVGLITILDTPGHEAFSAMRERGAEVTDIVVLVIAGDEGVRTQTIEALRQAKQAGVCLVVAINKCDKPNFDADTIYRQLADHDLLPEAWGGSVITVKCSALTGEGIQQLLEMLALQSEVLELKANPTTRARGNVIESEMHKGRGAVATILVQNGTLKLGDALVFGHLYARVKTMHNEHGKELQEAGPSTPVKITGLSGVPLAGSEFVVVKSEKEAREISEKRDEGHKSHLLQQTKKFSMESLLVKTQAGEKKILNLILKADVQGSLEALKNSLSKLPSEKVTLNFIYEGVGEIGESDIQYAATSKAVILGFHTRVEGHAEPLIKLTKTDVRLHNIIYHAVDDVKAIMLSLLDKIPQENELGEAVVRATFKSSQLGSIAGCYVSTGLIRRNCQARLIRDKEVLWKGSIASLKRVKEDVKEMPKGHECGILLQGFSDYKEGDIIQAYEIIYLQQELS